MLILLSIILKDSHFDWQGVMFFSQEPDLGFDLWKSSSQFDAAQREVGSDVSRA